VKKHQQILGQNDIFESQNTAMFNNYHESKLTMRESLVRLLEQKVDLKNLKALIYSKKN